MSLSGSPFDYLVAFLGGVLVSFTPCTYPLIPVSAGFIGVRAAGSRLRGFSLSLVYVTGVAVTYSILGILASLTGKLFGAISAHPFTYIFVGIVIIIFSLSMMGVFTFRVPHFFNAPQHKKGSYFSTFVLGLSSGLIIGPCLTPVLGAILVYLTTKTNIVYGSTLLFAFAYGMGLPLILIGTFSSVLLSLPKAGKWLDYIKKATGLILLLTGLYFIITGIRRM
ncbi:MAG: cytochrome c biogenesis protein CcdA [Candidatus Omnitrophota bacterium]